MNRMKNLMLLWLMSLTVAMAQQTITGVVLDDQGQPLPSATVQIKGTNTGTSTDFDGNYSIAASNGDVLVFSYVGFSTQEVGVAGQDQINVTLAADNQLDEVVVSALGVSREKKSLGYAQQSVQGETLVQSKEVDLNVTLSGKVAGVQMIGGSSSTFDAGFLRLRGETGVLYVVDGIKVNAMTDINTDNIANISVLKGAAATALYGADAVNGVVIITSKKAADGESTFTVDHTTNVTSVSILPNYQNEYGGGYYQYFDTFKYNPTTDPASWAAFEGQNIPYYGADESWGPRMDGTLVRHWDSWIPGHPEFGKLRPWEPNPDNVRNFYETGITHNTTLAYAQGGENYNIRSSMRNLSQTLVFPEAKRDQIDFNITASIDLSDSFEFYSSLNYQFRETANSPENGYGGLGANFNQWWQRQLDMDRLRESYFFEGNFYSWNMRSPQNPRPQYWDAPHFMPQQNQNMQRKDVAFGNMGLNYQFNENLKFNLEVRRRFNNFLSNGRTAFGGLSLPGYSESNFRYIQNEVYGQATYNKRFGDLDVNALAGYQMQQNRANSMQASTVGGLSVPDFYSVATSVDRPNYTGRLFQSKLMSNFAQVSLGYKSTFYLDASYRLDWGSTANEEDNRIETFGISGSLLIDELLDLGNTVSFAKLRGGYSQAPIFPNPYQTTMVYNVGNPYGSNPSFAVPNTQANPNLLGGTRDELEIGLELRFFENRLGLDVTYFDRIDKELPISIPVAASSGFSGLSINSGQTSSNGIEITFNATPIQKENFKWDFSVNLATLQKTVDFLAEGIDVNVLRSGMSWGGLQLQEIVGEEWGQFVGRKQRFDASGLPVLEEDGYLVADPNEKLGNILPDFTGGVLSSLQYKNVFLNIGIDYQKGGLFYSTTNMFAYYSGLHQDTVGTNDKGNPVRDSPDAGGGYHVVGVSESGAPIDFYMEASEWGKRYFALWGAHDPWLYDASYIKLRQLRLGYAIPNAMLEGTFIKSADVSILGNNLLLLYSNIPQGGLDPSEIEGSGSIAGEFRSVEGGQLPPSRSIGLNVKLNF